MIGLCGNGKIGKLLYENLKREYDIKKIKNCNDMQKIKTLIDFSNVSAKEVITTALEKGINVIMGTTGYDENELHEFEKKALENNCIFYNCCNFALNISLFYDMGKILENTNAFLIEKHDITKHDCPSGTAKHTAKLLQLPMDRITSIRRIGEQATHILVFETKNEIITLKHKIKSKEAYIEGFTDFFRKLVKEYDQRII